MADSLRTAGDIALMAGDIPAMREGGALSLFKARQWGMAQLWVAVRHAYFDSHKGAENPVRHRLNMIAKVHRVMEAQFTRKHAPSFLAKLVLLRQTTVFIGALSTTW